jgi:transposase
MTEIEIQSERVDDIPLLIGQQQQMGLVEIIDETITPHGGRQGLSVGQTVLVWLSFILSEADHRLSYVEPWVARHQATLKQLVDPALQVTDFTDDRLGDVLRYLSDDEAWSAIEQQLGQRLVRVYRLALGQVRLDSTSVSLYHEAEGKTLISYGHSKDHRPDLAQVKVMLGSLDPMGLPLATRVVAGKSADDPLYIPAVDEVRAVVGQRGLLYLGDSKMETLDTRAHLVAGQDYYLLPLSVKGSQGDLLAELVEAVLSDEQPLIDVYDDTAANEEPRLLARGYETSRSQSATVAGQSLTWAERLLVIYSPSLAKRAQHGLESRLQQAEQRLAALTPPPGRGQRQYDDPEALQTAAEAILSQQRVSDLLMLRYERQATSRHIRPYKDRPARTVETVRYQLHLQRNEAALAAQHRTLGWRLYALNLPTEQFSLAQAVRAYRGAPAIERNFARLKGRPLGLSPVHLRREDHLVGLIRLLSLALRVLTLTEFVARRALETAPDGLAGLYPGNPKQQTRRPTTERLLAAFKDITLSFVHLPGQTIVHITPLTPLQGRILSLLGLPTAIYTDLAAISLSIPP